MINVYRRGFSSLIKRICIIGVQRSGTTLLGAIFKVRPDVTYFGDGYGVPALRDFHLVETDLAVYKVTQITQQPERFESNVIRLFCERDIKDTVSSMLKLGWITEGLAGNELKDCLYNCNSEGLIKYCNNFNLDFSNSNQLHKIAALVVGFKKHFFSYHENIMKVKYEQLVSQPFSVIKEICDFCKIDLDPVMLEHHKHLSGELHGTEFKRKIDKCSIGKNNLNPVQISEILQIEKEVNEFSLSG